MLLAEIIQQAVRHEAAACGFYRSDLIGLQCHILAVESAQHRHLRVALGEEAAEAAAVFRLHQLILEALADFGVRIDDADEHRAEVVALVGGEIRPDFSALEKN